jgi:uncharacterized membrane protein YhaH (DUF805 family)
MDILFSGIGLLLLDALVLLLLFVSIHGQYKILFSPLGRISRTTFWDGMAAWFLLNILTIILGIAHSAFPFDDRLALGFDDINHVLYHQVVMALTLVYWLGSLWIFTVLCAKRWHDLNFSGWLALINAVPVFTFGAAWWVFIGAVGLTMNRHLALDSRYSPFDLWKEMFPYGLPSVATWSWTSLLSCCLIIAIGAYLGFAEGDTGGNAYGKSAV